MWWWSSASPLVRGLVGARPGAFEGGGADAAGVAADWGELHPLIAGRERDLVGLPCVGAAGRLLFGAVDDQAAEDDVAASQVFDVDHLVGADAPAVLVDEQRPAGAAPLAGERCGRLWRCGHARLELVDRELVVTGEGADGEGVQARLE